VAATPADLNPRPMVTLAVTRVGRGIEIIDELGGGGGNRIGSLYAGLRGFAWLRSTPE